jgi:hypothetical protein
MGALLAMLWPSVYELPSNTLQHFALLQQNGSSRVISETRYCFVRNYCS